MAENISTRADRRAHASLLRATTFAMMAFAKLTWAWRGPSRRSPRASIHWANQLSSFAPAFAFIKARRIYGKGWHRMTLEALSSLKALGKQLRLKLLESPEFRALEVVDRTILELSSILDSSAPPPGGVISPAPVEEAPGELAASILAGPQHAETSPLNPTNSQSRMARAIAATIAANTAASGAPPGPASRFNHPLSVAS